MKKILSVLLALVMLFSFAACTEKTAAEEVKTYDASSLKVLYNQEDYIMSLEYGGLNMNGLNSANERFGSDKYSALDLPAQGCSITFADYINGRTGAVRNMDLQLSQYCSYEFIVHEGENTKYPFWGLAYLGADEKSFKEMIDLGISDDVYNMVPFLATDTMSFGRDVNGDRASLYCAVLMRAGQYDENHNNIWRCSGTYPGAENRCCTQSAPAMLASSCISIEDALKMVGAVDESYRRLFPEIEPTLDVYTFNSPLSNWFEVVAMEDSTGRHGVLEFIDNKAIWHEGIDYSFNFFLQDNYLYNEDGTYKEQYGAGIGRYNATVPYLKDIYNVADHVSLMDGIRYSYMTYYSEPEGYIGRDFHGNPVDWRTEEAGADPWASYASYKEAGLDLTEADSKYDLWVNYIDANTGKLVRIDSLEEYLANADHLNLAWDMNYCTAEEHREEIMNYIRWNGAFFNSLTPHEVSITKSGWETYFRVICDPMAFKVTRYFNENITTADTITWDMVAGE